MGYKDILLSPIKIGNRTIQNRFFIQTIECNDEDEYGNPSDITTERYVNLAKGEAGLASLEAISVTRESRSRDNQMMLIPENEKALTEFMKKVKAAYPNMLFIFQLTHTGELSNPEFSRRVTVKPLPGYDGEIMT